jgi:hypothetical protein
VSGDFKSGIIVWSQLSIPKSSLIVNVRQLQDIFIFWQLWFQHVTIKISPETPSISRSSVQVIIAACIVIQQVDLFIDLGPSIGRIKLAVSDIVSSFKLNQKGLQLYRLIHFGLDKILVNFEGRFAGSVSLDSLCGIIEAKDPHNSESGMIGCESTISAMKFGIDLQYQFERLFILGFSYVTDRCQASFVYDSR